MNGTDFAAEEAGLHLWAQQKKQYNKEVFYFIPYLSQFALQCEMNIMWSYFEGVIIFVYMKK